MKRTRISVNLIHYYQDHRQLAKIFVKNDMQTIEDLQNHIIKLFNIDKNFYLMCQNHYIPSVESIHVLNDNDLIYVIPNLNATETIEKTTVKKKKKKDSSNIETVKKVKAEKKLKKKKKQSKENSKIIENNTETNDNEEEEEKVTKKKNKRKKHEEENTKKSSQLSDEELMETSNIVTNNNVKVSEKKKRKNNEQTLENAETNTFSKNKSSDLSQEINDYNSFKEKIGELPKNILNETIIFRKSNKFDSIFTHQNSLNVTETEDNFTYSFEKETRRKRRRCISPPTILTEETEIEENIDNTNKSIVQTIETLSSNEHNELMKNIKHTPRQSYSLADFLHFKNQSSSPATNEIEAILGKSSNRIMLRSTRKQLSGVGKVLEFIKTEQESDDISENNESTYPVTKRKRVRTRKRKTKNTESFVESNEHTEQPVFIPPKSIAAPKLHIKFEDNLVDSNANSVKGYLTEKLEKYDSPNNFVHSTPISKSLESLRKPANSNKTRRISIADINPDELPLMAEVPAVNNIILFKKLKLGTDYNPILSNYILAEIMEIAKNGNELHLKIFEGHEELEDPIGGKFSFNMEYDDEAQNDYDYDQIQILERNTLIDPKIVNFESQ